MYNQPFQPGTRAYRTLKALYENGPMSSRGLHELLEPESKLRRMQDCVKDLRGLGLIVPRFASMPKNVGNYYQLTYRKDIIPILSSILNVDVESINTPGINSTELIHSQDCAIWAKRFQQMWPEVKILRDHLYQFSEEAQKVLLMSDNKFEVIPDLLLLFPKSENQHPVRIAVEIERTRKANARVLRKLKKFASGTRLDGVIYVCSSEEIQNAVCNLYQKNVVSRALRINHYASRFLMLVQHEWYQKDAELKMLDADHRCITFSEWRDFLIKNPPDSSRAIHSPEGTQAC